MIEVKADENSFFCSQIQFPFQYTSPLRKFPRHLNERRWQKLVATETMSGSQVKPSRDALNEIRSVVLRTLFYDRDPYRDNFL